MGWVVVRRTLIGMLHGDLVIEGEWDFMLGEGVKGLLYWWQTGGTRVNIES